MLLRRMAGNDGGGCCGIERENLLLPNESLVCPCCSLLFLLLCLFRRKCLTDWGGKDAEISDSPRVTGLDADVAAAVIV